MRWREIIYGANRMFWMGGCECTRQKGKFGRYQMVCMCVYSVHHVLVCGREQFFCTHKRTYAHPVGTQPETDTEE